MSDGQLVCWRPNVDPLVVENHVLHMDKLSRDPHAGCRIEEVTTLEEALADRTAPDLLIEAGG